MAAITDFLRGLIGLSSDASQVKPQPIPSLAPVTSYSQIEQQVNEIFSRASFSTKKALCRMFPKGADLHIHMAGSYHPEILLDFAVELNLSMDPKNCLFYSQEDLDKPANAKVKARAVSAKDLQTPQYAALLNKYQNDVSMRDATRMEELPHDHFMYDCFPVVFSIIQYVDPQKQLQTVRDAAKDQNIQLLELMVGVDALKAMIPHFPDMKLDEGTKVRFIIETSRLVPVCSDNKFQGAIEEAFQLINKNPEVKSVNMVGPENHPTARKNFLKQLDIIEAVWEKRRQTKITMHAGELTAKVTAPVNMKNRIIKTLVNSPCDRIGHAVSLAYESDFIDTLNYMKFGKIAVEICLTSNERILGVEGKDHPFLTYLEYGIPVILCSDDAGLNLSDLSDQYYTAMTKYGIDYPTIKRLSRNGLECSSLDGEGIFEDRDTSKFSKLFEGKDFASNDFYLDPAVTSFLEASEKARAQVALEKALIAFEEKVIMNFRKDLLKCV